MGDTILLRLEYDQGDARERVVDLKQQLKAAREEFNNLYKQVQAGTMTSTEFAKKQAEIESQIKSLKTELAANVQVVKQQDAANKAATDSLSKMGASHKEVARQATALTRTKQDQTAATEAEQEAIDRLIDGLDNLENKTERVTDSTRKSEKASKDSKKSVTDYIKELSPLGVNLGDLSDKFQNGWDTATTFGKGILSLRGGLVALMAVPIVAAFTLIVAALTRTQKGVDFLERKTAAFTAVLGFLADKVGNVGEAIYRAFTGSENIIGQIGETIKKQLIDRFTLVSNILSSIWKGDWKGVRDGAQKFADDFKTLYDRGRKFGEQLGEVASKQEEITRKSQQMREEERKLNVEREKNMATIEQLKMLSDDTSKSESIRLKAARDAFNLEQSTTAKLIQLEERRKANKEDELKLGNKMAKDNEDLAQIEINISKLRGESATRLTELQNKQLSIRKEASDKAKELSKQELETEIGNLERLLKVAQENGEKTLAIEEGLIEKKALLAKKDATTKKQRDLIDANAAVELTNLRLKTAIDEENRLGEIRESGIKYRLEQVNKGSREELDLIKDLIQSQSDAEKCSVTESIKNKEQRDAKIKEIDARTKTALLQAETDFANAQRDIQEATDDRQNARYQKRLSREVSSIDDRLAVVRKGSKAELELNIDRLNQLEKQEREQNEKDPIRLEEIRQKYIKLREKADQDYLASVVELGLSVAGELNNTLSSIYAAQEAIQSKALQQQQEAALKSAGNNAELRAAIEEEYEKRREKLEKEVGEKKQRAARIEAGINTAVAFTKALTVGPILGPILAGFIAIQGFAQQALISAQEFAEGGVFELPKSGPIVRGVGGPKSDNINAKLSPGESVINAKSTMMFYPQLSEINQRGGGRAFPGTEALSQPMTIPLPDHIMHYAGGGVFASNQVERIDYNKLAQAMSQLPAPRVAVDEISRVQNRVAVREAANDFG
ncbi:hypothetical protein [Larkinella terrae]|uniref:Uncharacterized protein n=1 Tax=Larkinella terrae TaxID=2025311 RepID=A0A7K0EIJ8_9BACT|nr:hypothetical protein [Larkinella terrae]MRS61670.1 hypothetical protein [Larkinella terrae]